MRILLVVLSLFILGSAVCAEGVIESLAWQDYAGQKSRTGGEVYPPNGDADFYQLEVANPESRPATIHIFTFGQPEITSRTYAVVGKVRCEGVTEGTYVEMISIFGDGGQYFSRTLGRGKLSPLRGTSGWREFVLPFEMDGKADRPTEIVLNVVFPGKGTVYLGPLQLVEPAPSLETTASGVWLGAVGGLLGLLLGALGVVSGSLAPKGRARGFVMGTWYVAAGVGAAVLVAGIIALIVRQPYAVYYPLLLTGVIVTVLSVALIPVIRRRYDEFELRKMSAQDAVAPTEG